MTSGQREAQGLAFACMQAQSVERSSSDGLNVTYVFQRHPDYTPQTGALQSFLEGKMNVGDLVVISSEDGKHLAFATGIIVELTDKSVVVTLDSPLRLASQHAESPAHTIAQASQSNSHPLIPLRVDRDMSLMEPRAVRGSLAAMFVDRLGGPLLEESKESRVRRVQMVVELQAPVFAPSSALPGIGE